MATEAGRAALYFAYDRLELPETVYSAQGTPFSARLERLAWLVTRRLRLPLVAEGAKLRRHVLYRIRREDLRFKAAQQAHRAERQTVCRSPAGRPRLLMRGAFGAPTGGSMRMRYRAVGLGHRHLSAVDRMLLRPCGTVLDEDSHRPHQGRIEPATILSVKRTSSHTQQT